jgi:hypothetical protein
MGWVGSTTSKNMQHGMVQVLFSETPRCPGSGDYAGPVGKAEKFAARMDTPCQQPGVRHALLMPRVSVFASPAASSPPPHGAEQQEA